MTTPQYSRFSMCDSCHPHRAPKISMVIVATVVDGSDSEALPRNRYPRSKSNRGFLVQRDVDPVLR